MYVNRMFGFKDKIQKQHGRFYQDVQKLICLKTKNNIRAWNVGREISAILETFWDAEEQTAYFAALKQLSEL